MAQTTATIRQPDSTVKPVPITTTVRGVKYERWLVDHGTVKGRRTRRTFKTEAAALAHISKQAGLSKKVGRQARKLTDESLLDAAQAVGLLKKSTTLTAAAQFWLKHNRPDGPTRTVDELVEDYIQSRIEKGVRHHTVTDLRYRLGRGKPVTTKSGRVLPAFGFALDFLAIPAAHVTTDGLATWISKNGTSADKKRKYRTKFFEIFNYALSRKFVSENPATPLDKPNVERSKPYVMPIADVQKLMKTAQAICPELAPYLALCLFAGIRPSEAARLEWKAISIDRREVFIDAAISKTHDDRYVEMSENLAQWLFKHRRPAGTVYFSRKYLDDIRNESGVRWEHDCMRHSFGSYHLAAYENAGKTSLQMGHRSLGMLFEHYRRAVRKEDALQFWAIIPETATLTAKASQIA